MGGAEGFAVKNLDFRIKKYYFHHGPFHVVQNLLQKQNGTISKNSSQIAAFVLCMGMNLKCLYGTCNCTLASDNKFYDFTCTFTVALVQDYETVHDDNSVS